MENNSYQTNICGLFATSAIIIYGTIIFYKTFSFDMTTVLYALKNLLFTGLIFGFLGFKIGKIIDYSYSKRIKNIKNKQI